VQRTWRRQAGRKKFHQIRAQTKPAVVIQSAVRGWLVRKNKDRILAAHTLMYYLRWWCTIRHTCARKAQTWWRTQHRKRVECAVLIQRSWRGHVLASRYQAMRQAASRLQRAWRMRVVGRFVKQAMRMLPTVRLMHRLPASPATWSASNLGFDLLLKWRMWMAHRRLQGLTPSGRQSMRRKVLAHRLFGSLKSGYAASIPAPFEGDRLGLMRPGVAQRNWQKTVEDGHDSDVLCSGVVMKKNRHHKFEPCGLALTGDSIYRMHVKTFKLKARHELDQLRSVLMSPFGDDLVILRFEGASLVGGFADDAHSRCG
jgi:hypothetical protein